MAKKTSTKAATPKKAPAKKAPRVRTIADTSLSEPVQSPPAVERTLKEIVGHQRAIGVLREAITADRVHHAWVFAGPDGVGKRTTALAFARELLLPVSGDAQHEQLDAQLRAGAHPDLHLITAKLARVSREQDIRNRKQTTLPREVVLEFLVEPATRTRVVSAASPASKVFIVDDAHMMGDAAQNLLLKTLEEPPSGTVIILVLPSEAGLLATIRSRCQRVAFGPLSKEEMASFVGAIPEEMTDEQRYIATALSEGSPGRLRQVLDGNLVEWVRELEGMFRAADAGEPVPELGIAMAKLVEAEATRQVGSDKLASKESANRRAAADMLRLVAERHRRNLQRKAESQEAAEHHARAIEAVSNTERLLASNVPLAHAFGLLAAELWSGR